MNTVRVQQFYTGVKMLNKFGETEVKKVGENKEDIHD